MLSMKTKKTFNDLYSFPGFRARSKLTGIFGDSPARLVTLVRCKKKWNAAHAAQPVIASTIARCIGSAMLIPEARGCTWNLTIAGWTVGSVVL